MKLIINKEGDKEVFLIRVLNALNFIKKMLQTEAVTWNDL